METNLIVFLITYFSLAVVAWLSQRTYRKQRKLLKLLKEKTSKVRNKLKETKQKTIKFHFQNLVNCEKEIKWAEEEIEI